MTALSETNRLLLVVCIVFLASLSSQTVTALVLKHTGHRPIMLVGMISFLCGISGIVLSTSLTWLLIAAVCKGIGDGALLLLGNVLAAEASKGAGPLNLVKAMFDVGAMGHLDLGRFLETLFSIGYRGAVAMECDVQALDRYGRNAFTTDPKVFDQYAETAISNLKRMEAGLQTKVAV